MVFFLVISMHENVLCIHVDSHYILQIHLDKFVLFMKGCDISIHQCLWLTVFISMHEIVLSLLVDAQYIHVQRKNYKYTTNTSYYSLKAVKLHISTHQRL